MNAERLHALASALRDDFAGTGVLVSLQQLRDALQSQVNSPQDPSYQQQVATSLDAVVAASEASAVNEFPATSLETLEELEVDRVLGRRLGAAVREIFERNQITPSVAAAEVGELYTTLEAMSTQLGQLVAGLEHFGIGAEVLEAGEAEVGVLIPRGAVNNHLDELGGEFQRLRKLLGPFLELGTGSRPPIEVVTISSTDFGVFLDVAPKAAMFVAVAVERIVALYKSLLEIRKLRQDMEDCGVPAESLVGVDEHANSVMERGIEAITSDLITEAPASLDGARRHELENELRVSLNGIANRIDAGFNIDVRGEAEETADGEEPSDDAAAIQAIRDASPNLKFINRSGRPILSLPEETGDSSAKSSDE